MSASAKAPDDIDDAEAKEPTVTPFDKAQAILDLIISDAATDGDFITVTSAALAVSDMTEEANQINS